jgi:hypothetical protein
MSKGGDQPFDKAAEAIWNAEFLVVIAGPNFDEGSRNPFSSEFCDYTLVSKPNKLMGFWGAFYNEYVDKSAHDGFLTLARWRDRLFCADDIRKRQQKRRPDDDAEAEKQIPRFMVFTPLVSNLFQKAGVPSDEIFEPCGNVFHWQCAAQPPCSSRAFPLDRGFRFAIDDSTQEALPIKYVADRRDVGGTGAVERVSQEDVIFNALAAEPTKLLEVNGRPAVKEDRNQRTARALAAATVRRIDPRFQVLPRRFADRFVGFPETTKSGFAAPDTFAGLPQDAEAVYVPAADTDASAPAVTAEPAIPPTRGSHFYEHYFGLSTASPLTFGQFFAADPHKVNADREAKYSAATQEKTFVSNAHTLATKRAKYVRYNVSVAFGDGADSGHAAGLIPDQVVDELGADGILGAPGSVLYLSNLSIRATLQEPVYNKHHDVVRVSFPDADQPNAVAVPETGLISLVCETVVGEAPDAKKDLKKTKTPNACPFNYGAHVWQIAGHLSRVDIPRVPKETPDPKAPDPRVGEFVEYILESTQRYVVKLGVRRTHPDTIAYLELEIPCNEESPGVQSVVERSSPPVNVRSGLVSRRPPVPTPNHILCPACHGIARPFVPRGTEGRRLLCLGARVARKGL